MYGNWSARLVLRGRTIYIHIGGGGRVVIEILTGLTTGNNLVTGMFKLAAHTHSACSVNLISTVVVRGDSGSVYL